MAASGAYAELQSAIPEGCQLLTMDAVRSCPVSGLYCCSPCCHSTRHDCRCAEAVMCQSWGQAC